MSDWINEQVATGKLSVSNPVWLFLIFQVQALAHWGSTQG